MKTVDIFNDYKKQPLNLLHLTHNYDDCINCINLCRPNNLDKHVCYADTTVETINLLSNYNYKFDFLYIDTNVYDISKLNELNEYMDTLIRIILIIFKNMSTNGTCVLKIGAIFYKQIIEFIYILSSAFDKTSIFKPFVSNPTSFDKYLICQNFMKDQTIQTKTTMENNCLILSDFLKNKNKNKNKNQLKIQSMLDFDIPLNYMIKIVDINSLIGQQQIEYLNSILNLLRNKNKCEKIIAYKKLGFQKSVLWCEKYKIPHNVCCDKTMTLDYFDENN